MEVCRALTEELKDEVMPLPRTPAEWRAIAQRFQDKWDIPHAMGALDGKHIAIKKPNQSASVYYNYKGYFSVVLLALVDADYKFIWIDVGGVGSQSDAQLFRESDLKAAIDDKSINFPAAEPLPGSDEDMPLFFLGDEAFPLRTYMMKPYSKPRRGDPRVRVANYRISRGRRVVENGFGILSNRFRCFLRTMEQTPDSVRTTVEAAVLLHNLLRIRHPGEQLNNVPPRPNAADARNALLLEVPQRNAGRQDDRDVDTQRDRLKDWFHSPAGSIPWQDEMAAVEHHQRGQP